jgi:branched-subunit amino acid aminotransferase/4-amino-4-deoxychorismate lyase
MSRIALCQRNLPARSRCKNLRCSTAAFLFADGVYEVTPIVNGKLVDYDAHIERLDRSLGELRMAWPCSKPELRAMHEELVKRNALKEGIIYMQVTRGVADRQFNFPKDAKSSLVAFPQSDGAGGQSQRQDRREGGDHA